jgi:adenylate cyclase
LTALEAITHFDAEKYEAAARLVARAIEERADFAWPHFIRAAALGQLGRADEARDAVSKLLRIYPRFSLVRHERAVPIAKAEQRARYIEGLRRAGLPE